METRQGEVMFNVLHQLLPLIALVSQTEGLILILNKFILGIQVTVAFFLANFLHCFYS